MRPDVPFLPDNMEISNVGISPKFSDVRFFSKVRLDFSKMLFVPNVIKMLDLPVPAIFQRPVFHDLLSTPPDFFSSSVFQQCPVLKISDFPVRLIFSKCLVFPSSSGHPFEFPSVYFFPGVFSIIENHIKSYRNHIKPYRIHI